MGVRQWSIIKLQKLQGKFSRESPVLEIKSLLRGLVETLSCDTWAFRKSVFIAAKSFFMTAPMREMTVHQPGIFIRKWSFRELVFLWRMLTEILIDGDRGSLTAVLDGTL